MIKIDPSVDALIKPIIYDMTKISIAQKTNSFNNQNEPDAVKEKKKECVHIIYDGGEYRLDTDKTTDDKLVCKTCGREIGTKFDEESINKIMDAIPVINQILLFGMLNGLRAEPIATLISLKKTLPAAAKLMKELNIYVKNDESNADSEKNIGLEYNTPGSFRSITSF